jgi:hypothetical protein
MDPEELRPDIQERRENKDPGGEAWYAGLNSPLEEDSRALCTILMSHIGIAPRSRGVEYILTALEAEGDTHKKAMCLGDVLDHLANDPSDYYHRVLTKRSDFTSTHGFNHHEDDFYKALGIDTEGQLEVMRITVELSGGILQSIFDNGALKAKSIAVVFERVLGSHSNTDKTIIATAIYNFFTAPLLGRR